VTVRALVQGKVNAANIFSTSPAIPKNIWWYSRIQSTTFCGKHCTAGEFAEEIRSSQGRVGRGVGEAHLCRVAALNAAVRAIPGSIPVRLRETDTGQRFDRPLAQ